MLCLPSLLSSALRMLASTLAHSYARTLTPLSRPCPPNVRTMRDVQEVPAEKFAFAVTTRSGQRFSLGDTKDFFCLQSVSKVGTYCEALKMHGTARTHTHVGREPSGQSFNAMTLKAVDMPDHPDRHAIPHNPCINAGAIMCTSLNSPGLKESQRLAEYVPAPPSLLQWQSACSCGLRGRGGSARVLTFICATPIPGKVLAIVVPPMRQQGRV
jgi:hypothetical protein